MSFNFETNHTADLYPNTQEAAHYDVFPKAIGSILQNTNARELHLRFGQGWYDADAWGKLLRNGLENGGTGVELWAVIEAESKDDAFVKWSQLTNSLSGLFCASLNFIDSSTTTSPVTIFQPDGSFLQKIQLKNDLYLLRGALPREPVCTENLTPFLKMLPTKGKAGISSLLTGRKVFNSEWSSMAVDVLTVCDSPNSCHYEIKQSLDLIKNIPHVLDKNRMPIPKPIPGDEMRCDETKKHDAYHCFPLPESNKLDFGLMDLFGRVIHGGALLADSPTRVCADIDTDSWELSVNSTAALTSSGLCYDLNTNQDYDFRLSTNDSTKIKPLEAPPIYASRSLSGYSQDSGGFRIDLLNPTNDDLNVVVFETFPWFVRLYLHTLTISVNDTTTYDVSDRVINSVVNEIIYNPAVDRKSPSHLELMTLIPANTKVKLSLDFDKAMLLYAEYPPDANHGFEIEPAVISIIDPITKEINYQMRTTTALLTLPTPDFSMPYNVIIITSTVMSLAFGSFFNLLTKKTVTEEEAEAVAEQSRLRRITKKLQELKQRIRGSKEAPQ
ncbi:DEKNAAC101640 [Brettanomyces naardenensis]|uniref:DEKNAAC101640 n=1 Tax=Brettanomyces naardenensis TaxID=13370 RepID=A0A448YIF6_BRENA|nr:DEKNAAC101640 [Brettanomyces naardenensis]